MEEIWVTIEEAPNYEVSNHYHVRRKKSGRPVKPANAKYSRIILMVDGNRVSFDIRQLVQDHFGDHHIDPDERWRPIEYFDNYQVSNKGRVRNANTGRILSARQGPTGNPKVDLTSDGDYRVTRSVAVLVREAFW